MYVYIHTYIGLECEVITTTHHGHAAEVIASSNLDKYSAVLSVSGDGTVNEIYTGLISRPDSAKAVLMPVGIVPAGSEGTLAKMATYFNPFAAAYVILKSHEVRPLDVLKVAQGAEICFALCGVGWGIPGKVAEESEQLRSTYGRSRYAVSAIKEFVAFKGCSGSCSTLLLPLVAFFFSPFLLRLARVWLCCSPLAGLVRATLSL
jgi:diacylglycerol kinase family enzyme